MKVLDIIETDFVNYKKPCMTIMFPFCSFKCDIEAGKRVCQNSGFASADIVEVDRDEIIQRYLDNPVTEAVVMQGLEPFDSFDDLYSFIYKFTEVCNDDIVIYTGYREDEIDDAVDDLCSIVENNKVIIKFGRFIPNGKPVFDETLGVTLQSSNQYARVVHYDKGI